MKRHPSNAPTQGITLGVELRAIREQALAHFDVIAHAAHNRIAPPPTPDALVKRISETVAWVVRQAGPSPLVGELGSNSLRRAMKIMTAAIRLRRYESWGPRVESFEDRILAVYPEGESTEQIISEPQARVAFLEAHADVLEAFEIGEIAKVQRSTSGQSPLPAKSHDLTTYFDSADLTDKQRECASLKWEYELSISEIARRVNLHRTTVQEHLDGAEKRMKRSGEYLKAQKHSSKNRSDRRDA